jgi:hypothetical protein
VRYADKIFGRLTGVRDWSGLPIHLTSVRYISFWKRMFRGKLHVDVAAKVKYNNCGSYGSK